MLLCCCAPAYSHEDTVITEGELVGSAAVASAGLRVPDAHDPVEGGQERHLVEPRRARARAAETSSEYQ